MTTWQVTVERRIAAPAARVWETLTDIARSPHVIAEVERVELLDGDSPFGVGTRWRETRLIFGKESTDEKRVTAADPAKRLVVESDSRGVHYTSEFTLAPADGDAATSIRLTLDAETDKQSLTGTMGTFLTDIGAKAAAKSLAEDLDGIAASAEETKPA
jgi:uncharacterized protein YndB with AHSA1/START domain